MDLDDAYAVQRAVQTRREVRGYRVIGFRLVFLQEPGVVDLAYGVLYQSSICPSGAGINWPELLEPRIEPALAIVTNAPVRGGACTVEEVQAAIDSVMPAFDVTDSRYRGWDADSLSNIADNCAAGRVILGQMRCAIGRLDRRAELAVARNGTVVARTTVGRALPDPASSLTALAKLLHRTSKEIPAGSIVLCADTTHALQAAERDTFTAFFDGLGPVKVRFASGANSPASHVTVTIKEH